MEGPAENKEPAENKAPADWLRDARWGIMTHYLGAPPSTAGGAELTAEAWIYWKRR